MKTWARYTRAPIVGIALLTLVCLHHGSLAAQLTVGGPRPVIRLFAPLGTIVHPHERIPLCAVVTTDSPVPATLTGTLAVPAGVKLRRGRLEAAHIHVGAGHAVTLRWVLVFPMAGRYSLAFEVSAGAVRTVQRLTITVTGASPSTFLLSAYNPPYAWHGPPYQDSAFLYYKNAGFDTMLWVRDDDALMAKVHKFGFTYFLDIDSLFSELDANGVDYLHGVQHPDEPDEKYNVAPQDITEEMLEQVDSVVEKYKNDPSLIGYWICDEPYPSAYTNIATVIRRIRARDPNHGCLVNIGDDEYTTDENVEDFINTTGVSVLMYDRYNFFNGYDLDDLYFQRLAMMRRHALKHHIPLYNTVQAVGTNGTSVAWNSPGPGEHLDWRTPNEAEHRWLVYSSLVYGVHGIVWFHWDAADWGVVENPDRNQIYRSLQHVNAEIHALGPIMERLTTTGVYHTDDTSGPEKCTRIVRNVSNHAALIVGTFKDKTDHHHYFMLMNKDYRRTVAATVTMNAAVDHLAVFDVHQRIWKPVPFERLASGTLFTVFLRKGGGKLFRYDGTLTRTMRNLSRVPGVHLRHLAPILPSRPSHHHW